MLAITLCRAITSPEEGWKATVCAMLSSACVGHTADREVGARPGVTARLQQYYSTLQLVAKTPCYLHYSYSGVF